MIFALDFDGVICDSIFECLETSYEAFLEFSSDGSLPEQIPKTWVNLFFIRRGYVRPSGNFLILWKWIAEFPNKNLTFNQFEMLCKENARDIEFFSELFHSLRNKKILNDKDLFIKKNKLFPGVKKNWPTIAKSPVYIITTKDIESVKIIMEAAKLDYTGAYARGTGAKSLSILKILEENKLNSKDVIFVDDSIAHLEEVSTTGCLTVHATWGYEISDHYYSGQKAACFEELITIMVKNDKNRN